MSVNFQLLGPAAVVSQGRTFVLPATKPSVVLATLLLHANEFVSTDHLYKTLWGDTIPESARATLQSNVMRSRQLLLAEGVPVLIRTLPGGYTIAASADTLDLLRFSRLIERAQRPGCDLEEESRCLSDAMSLWRGPALVNIPSDVLQREAVPMLTEQWLDATERWYDIELLLGRHSKLVGGLRSLTSAHPYRERFWEQLVEALYRSGRQTEALEEQRRVSGFLMDQLGVSPGPGLQRLELTILRGESLPVAASRSGDRVRISTVAAADRPDVRCQLPPRVPDFVGRSKMIAQVADELVADLERHGSTTVIVSGPPGVGKSAFGLWVAHEVRQFFPDGQWYARLVDADGNRRRPAEVLAELLSAAGLRSVDPQNDSAALDSALRTAIAGRRVLLVLDDAVDAEQARLLIPGTVGTAALVTSRASLVDAAVSGGVRCHRLDVLPMENAVELLSDILGRDVVYAERDAAMQLAECCGRLPMALRIAATKLINRPHQSLLEYLAWLSADPLTRLSIGKRRSLSVRGAFDMSYEYLGADAQRMLRLLGSVPRDSRFTIDDVANSTGATPEFTADALDELFNASLLESTSLDSFSMPPLLHLYAMRKAREEADQGNGCGT
jgi:DNA-binding SARP family transcriptional activator